MGVSKFFGFGIGTTVVLSLRKTNGTLFTLLIVQQTLLI